MYVVNTFYALKGFSLFFKISFSYQNEILKTCELDVFLLKITLYAM